MISVCMIVKNEINLLENCINSVRNKLGDVVNEYVVIDTGSTDGTSELAKKLRCEVYNFEWCEDFSKARNFSLSKAKNNWVFVIDADEFVDDINVDINKLCTNTNENFAFLVNIKSINEEGDVTDSSKLARVFNKKVYKYKNPVHEQLNKIDETAPKYKNIDIVLKHTGYLEEVIKNKNKLKNYKKILVKYLSKNENHSYMRGHLGVIYFNEKQYEKALKELESVVFNEKNLKSSFYSMMVNTYLKSLIALNKYEAGLMLSKVWEYCSNDDEYVYLIGKLYLLTEQYEKAIETLLILANKENKLSIPKKYPYYLLGLIFEKFDELNQALICYEKCGNFNKAKDKILFIKSKI